MFAAIASLVVEVLVPLITTDGLLVVDDVLVGVVVVDVVVVTPELEVTAVLELFEVTLGLELVELEENNV
jgi:hypothetical protein